jgi:hypothetical protein
MGSMKTRHHIQNFFDVMGFASRRELARQQLFLELVNRF